MVTMMIAGVPFSAQTAMIVLTKIGSICMDSTDIGTTAPTAVQRWMVMGMAKCGDCLHFPMCSNYVDAEETFPEVEGGCTVFKSKDAFVEVVRCKDCKHRVVTSDGMVCECALPTKTMKDYYIYGSTILARVEPDAFCSHGERKE